MASLTEDVCSICSEMCLSKGISVDEDLLERLALLVKIDTNALKTNQICETCAENIRDASNFKIHLKKVHEIHDTVETKGDIDSEILYMCQVCRSAVRESSSSLLLEFTKEFKYIVDYLPEELVVESTDGTYVCFSCQKSMLHLQSIMDLLSIYKENKANVSNIKVELDALNHEHKVEFKYESYTDYSDIISEHSTEIDKLIKNEDIKKVVKEDFKNEKDLIHEDFKCKNEEVDLKMESDETSVTEQLWKLDDAGIRPPSLNGLFNIYITYNCDLCDYKTSRKGDIKRHKLVHKDINDIKMFSCTMCDYKSRQKGNLKTHMITHKNIDEIEMFKCEYCNLKTRYKSKLKQHILIHNNKEAIPKLKCNYCDYQTIHKSGFKRHAIIHKNIDEIETFKCEVCGYLAKHKSYLKHHMLTHQNISEIKAFTCDVCGYKARHRSNLKTHTLMHKNVSEIKMLKCEYCDFQTKYKASFKMHMIIHKNENDIKMYACEACEYKTRRKENLKSHSLKHKKANEIELYKCNLCKFKTKHKQYLKKHALIHKDINEIERFECHMCNYKARQKGNLKTHLMLHKKRLKLVEEMTE